MISGLIISFIISFFSGMIYQYNKKIFLATMIAMLLLLLVFSSMGVEPTMDAKEFILRIVFGIIGFFAGVMTHHICIKK